MDYEELYGEQRDDYSHYARTAMELLPNKGLDFTLSNLLIKGTANPIPLISNPTAPELIQYVQGKKQEFWNNRVQKSYSNKIFCGLRYFQADRKKPDWKTNISEEKLFKFHADRFNSAANMLEQGYTSLANGLSRFKIRELTREESYAALYELIHFSQPNEYQPDLSLMEQLTQNQYRFYGNKEYIVVNDAEYISLIGIKYQPPPFAATHLKRFYELGFPLILRQAIGFHAKKLRVWEHFFVLVRAGNKKTLNIRRAEIISLLKNISAVSVAEELTLKAGFFSMLPGQDRLYTQSAPLYTTDTGDLLRVYSPFPGDCAPVDYLQDRFQGVFSYNPFTQREKAHHRAVCGPASDAKNLFVIKDLISHLTVNPMVWVVDSSASYFDLFELLKEEMPANTAIMRTSRDDSNFAFNPFLLADSYSDAQKEQVEFCMGFLKIMAGPEFRNAESKAVMSMSCNDVGDGTSM